LAGLIDCFIVIYSLYAGLWVISGIPSDTGVRHGTRSDMATFTILEIPYLILVP